MNGTINKILVSIAATQASITTAKYAISLAKLLGAELYAIYVIDKKSLEELLRARIFVKTEEMEYEAELEEQGDSYLKRIKEMAEAKDVKTTPILAKGTIHEEVVNKIEELGIDLLVMGELKRVTSRIDMIYDEGEQIFRSAQCSVTVVKNPEAAEAMYEGLK